MSGDAVLRAPLSAVLPALRVGVMSDGELRRMAGTRCWGWGGQVIGLAWLAGANDALAEAQARYQRDIERIEVGEDMQELRRLAMQASRALDDVDLPDRPLPEVEDLADKWLYRSGRSYLEQLSSYAAEQQVNRSTTSTTPASFTACNEMPTLRGPHPLLQVRGDGVGPDRT